MSENKFLFEMGKRIAERRKALHKTQEQVAEEMGISLQSVSCIELGKKAVRPDNLVKLCAALDTTADYILKNAVSDLKGGVNTAIGCVFTDAVLTREQANKLAEAAHNGLALSVSPVHTMLDGDTMFVMAGCEKTADFTVLTCAVPLAVRKAVLSAVKK